MEPGRTDTRRRFYSDADIERLLLLRRVVGTGRGISHVAGLTNDELRTLIDEEEAREPARPAADLLPVPGTGDSAEPFLALCLSAAQRLDVRDLEMQIERASVVLSRTTLLEKLLVPLMQRVGDLWHQGTLRPVHEHMTSAVVRSFIGGMNGAYAIPGTAPQLVVTTPSRQQHELGALVAAAMAASEGWQVIYLGPDLPPQEIAAAALQRGARAVALGLTYPPDDPLLVEDLKRLRRLLPPGTALIVGGRASCAYAATLDEIGARRVEDFEDLRRELQALRVAPSAS